MTECVLKCVDWIVLNQSHLLSVSDKAGWRYWHQRADERHGNLPQGNQELLVVRDKVGRPPGELGVSKFMECDIFPSVL